MLFLNNAVFQDYDAPIHTARTVESWFEEHEGELQHLPWAVKSPGLNTTEPLWLVSETRVRNRFPPPSPNQLEMIFTKKGIKFHYRLSKTCISPFQEGLHL
jgi:hypothetical protein